MIIVEYSRLQYKPTVTEDELIYVGIASHIYDGTHNYDSRKVHIVENKQRLYSFNDELDKRVIDIILSTIKREWEEYNLLSSYENYSTFNEFTRRHVNNFNFSPIEKTSFETIEAAEEFIDDTVRYILNYSIEKRNRMSRREKENYLNTVFSARYEDVYKNKQVKAEKTEEKIKFDFVIKDKFSDKNVYIKKLNVNDLSTNTVRSYTAFSMINNIQIIFSVTKGYEKLSKSVTKYVKESNNIIVPEEHLLEEVSKFLKEHQSEDVLV